MPEDKPKRSLGTRRADAEGLKSAHRRAGRRVRCPARRGPCENAARASGCGLHRCDEIAGKMRLRKVPSSREGFGPVVVSLTATVIHICALGSSEPVWFQIYAQIRPWLSLHLLCITGEGSTLLLQTNHHYENVAKKTLFSRM